MPAASTFNVLLCYFQASKFLIQAGSKLDYRRYAEALFDILITGGILAPGGTILTDNNAAKLCIFNTDEDLDSMRNITHMFERMIRQYKYLERSLDDEMKKVLIIDNRILFCCFILHLFVLLSPLCADICIKLCRAQVNTGFSIRTSIFCLLR